MTAKSERNTPITRAQIRAIKAIAAKLPSFGDDEYRDFLYHSFRVRTCKCLTSRQASDVIDTLRCLLNSEPAGPCHPAHTRIDEWNAELYSAGALRGLVSVSRGSPPSHKQIRNTAALLWRLCSRLYAQDRVSNPVAFARRIIRDATGHKGKIATAEESAAVGRAVIAALRQRGWYPETKDKEVSNEDTQTKTHPPVPMPARGRHGIY